MVRRTLGWWILLLALVMPEIAQAHSMYQSSVLLDIHNNEVDVEMQLPSSRLGDVLDVAINSTTLATQSDRIRAYCDARLSVKDTHGTAWKLGKVSIPEWRMIDGTPYIVIHLIARAPNDADKRNFILDDRIITERLRSHAVLVTVRSDWEGNVFANNPNLVGIITGDEQTLAIDLGPGSWQRGFGSVFRLGIEHIAQGTDHLLFLLALLLPAPLCHLGKHWESHASVRRSSSQIVKIATAFTFGHSLTLALAAFRVVHVPDRPIEILIAFSILVSAIHAVRPIFPGREAAVAAGFGLIHGLAFATTLADLGLQGWERLQGILAFNLGIEVMQLVVIACVMPSLVLLSRIEFYKAFRVTGALFAIAASSGWMIERISRRSLGVDNAVNVVAVRSAWIAMLLFLTALILYTAKRQKDSQPASSL